MPKLSTHLIISKSMKTTMTILKSRKQSQAMTWSDKGLQNAFKDSALSVNEGDAVTNVAQLLDRLTVSSLPRGSVQHPIVTHHLRRTP